MSTIESEILFIRRCSPKLFALSERHRRDSENEMAAHGEVEYATATGNDYAAHEATYRFFLSLTKWGLCTVVVILILMAIFLV
jgi:hypothetical protein